MGSSTVELLAIIGGGVTIIGVNLRLYAMLRNDINDMRKDFGERLAHIEGLIQGRFREGASN